MSRHFIFLVVSLMGIANMVVGQTKTTPDGIEDTTIGIKPTLTVENISASGHCDNQQFSFFAPWADHYELAKRRTDTSWIQETKSLNTWSVQNLKKNVNGMIYKQLNELGSYQFVVLAYKGDKYRISDTINLKACLEIPKQ